MSLLDTDEITKRLEDLKGWGREGKEICKTFQHEDFAEAIRFVNSVADLAEEANHHPDITINYNKVSLTLATHSEGGLTEKDFDLAGQIERLDS
jgi:4a-hydroxytetrahydrobiopterin dehydratase